MTSKETKGKNPKINLEIPSASKNWETIAKEVLNKMSLLEKKLEEKDRLIKENEESFKSIEEEVILIVYTENSRNLENLHEIERKLKEVTEYMYRLINVSLAKNRIISRLEEEKDYIRILTNHNRRIENSWKSLYEKAWETATKHDREITVLKERELELKRTIWQLEEEKDKCELIRTLLAIPLVVVVATTLIVMPIRIISLRSKRRQRKNQQKPKI